MAALEAEAQAAAEQAAEAEQTEAEGKEHPGGPDDQAQRNFTAAESRIMPAPGGRDFQQAYNCQAVVDSAHQVIGAARATNQSADKRQAVVMIEETIANTGVVPREVSADAGYYSAKVVTACKSWEWTLSSRRIKPATAGCCRQRPEAVYPVISPPGTGCGGSYRPGGAASATPGGWRRWSRSSARSSRAGASASSCCGDWRRSRTSGR